MYFIWFWESKGIQIQIKNQTKFRPEFRSEFCLNFYPLFLRLPGFGIQWPGLGLDLVGSFRCSSGRTSPAFGMNTRNKHAAPASSLASDRRKRHVLGVISSEK